MHKRGIDIPKIWMKGQIWYWNDPMYGSKTAKPLKAVPSTEIGLRYSRMVLIFSNDKIIPQTGGDILAIPLSSKQQYSTDVQVNISRVLRNESPTYVCTSSIRLIRSCDLAYYVCTLADSQISMINDKLISLLLNTPHDTVSKDTQDAPMKPRAVVNKEEELDALIREFIRTCIIPNPPGDLTWGCTGTNIWSAWLHFLQVNRTVVRNDIHEFARAFIEIHGVQDTVVDYVQNQPFSSVPFRFKVRDPLTDKKQPVKFRPNLNKKPEPKATPTPTPTPDPDEEYEPTPEEIAKLGLGLTPDEESDLVGLEDGENPETGKPETIKFEVKDERPYADHEKLQTEKVETRESLEVGPDHIIVDKDDYNTIVQRNVRGYYVIREKRVVGIMQKINLEKDDRILCFNANSKARMVFHCEQDIKDAMMYYDTHTMEATVKKLHINADTIYRVWAHAAEWAGCKTSAEKSKTSRCTGDEESPGTKDDELADIILFTLSVDTITSTILRQKWRMGAVRADRIIAYMEKHGLISEKRYKFPRNVLPTNASEIPEPIVQFLKLQGLNMNTIQSVMDKRVGNQTSIPEPQPEKEKEPEVEEIPVEEKTSEPQKYMLSNIDDKVEYLSRLIEKFAEDHGMYKICRQYELNHHLNLTESLFYRKIRTSAYFSVGELLNLPRTRNKYYEDARIILPDNALYKTYQMLEVLHTDPMFASKEETKVKISKMRNKYGPNFGLNQKFIEIFGDKVLAHMNLTEDGADVLVSLFALYFTEQNTAPCVLP